jgi:hypothetical protein
MCDVSDDIVAFHLDSQAVLRTSTRPNVQEYVAFYNTTCSTSNADMFEFYIKQMIALINMGMGKWQQDNSNTRVTIKI